MIVKNSLRVFTSDRQRLTAWCTIRFCLSWPRFFCEAVFWVTANIKISAIWDWHLEYWEPGRNRIHYNLNWKDSNPAGSALKVYESCHIRCFRFSSRFHNRLVWSRKRIRIRKKVSGKIHHIAFGYRKLFLDLKYSKIQSAILICPSLQIIAGTIQIQIGNQLSSARILLINLGARHTKQLQLKTS